MTSEPIGMTVEVENARQGSKASLQKKSHPGDEGEHRILVRS